MKPYYDNKGIRIYHGDCREILPTLDAADLVLTDPPYGIGEAAGKNKSRTNMALATDYGDSDWDNAPVDQAIIDMVVGWGVNAIVFGGNFYSFPPSPCWLVWDKDNTGDFADCELAWTNMKRAVRKIKYRWNGMFQEHSGRHKEKRYHPTQKPVAVMKWCIQQAPRDIKTVLDPFMGSGTTLVAAKQMNLECTGIEREERYCEIAANRLSQEVFDFGESSTDE